MCMFRVNIYFIIQSVKRKQIFKSLLLIWHDTGQMSGIQNKYAQKRDVQSMAFKK